MYGFDTVKHKLPGIEEHLSPRLAKIYADTQLRHPHRHHQMISPLQAHFLAFLVGLTQPTRILELGSFCGYSVAVFLHAAPSSQVHCVERDKECCEVLRENVPEAVIHHTTCDEFLSTTAQQIANGHIPPFDFCFVDADKKSYGRYGDLIKRVMRDGVLVVYDNVLFRDTVCVGKGQQQSEIGRSLRHFIDSKRSAVLLPAFDGLLLERIVKHY